MSPRNPTRMNLEFSKRNRNFAHQDKIAHLKRPRFLREDEDSEVLPKLQKNR